MAAEWRNSGICFSYSFPGLPGRWLRRAKGGSVAAEYSPLGIELAAVFPHSPPWGRGWGALHAVYPRFYLDGDPQARVPAAARAVNEEMPAYAVSLLSREEQLGFTPCASSPLSRAGSTAAPPGVYPIGRPHRRSR
jgi:hypothetical protein